MLRLPLRSVPVDCRCRPRRLRRTPRSARYDHHLRGEGVLDHSPRPLRRDRAEAHPPFRLRGCPQLRPGARTAICPRSRRPAPALDRHPGRSRCGCVRQARMAPPNLRTTEGPMRAHPPNGRGRRSTASRAGTANSSATGASSRIQADPGFAPGGGRVCPPTSSPGGLSSEIRLANFNLLAVLGFAGIGRVLPVCSEVGVFSTSSSTSTDAYLFWYTQAPPRSATKARRAILRSVDP